MKVEIFADSDQFRQWLEQNGLKSQELWVGFYNQKSGKKAMTYKEALDQALCFGWIDGIRKKVDENVYTNRFTPRKPKGNWSLVNVKRVEELQKMGLMKEAGLRAFEKRDLSKTGLYSFEAEKRELDEQSQKIFKKNKAAWEFFQAQSPWYRKTASWWVISAKLEETRKKRLAVLMEDSGAGRRLRQFNRPKA